MEILPNIIGYHTNDKERCEIFLEKEEYIIEAEDEDWLGTGMYFWDNLSNAKFWVKNKQKKINEVMVTEATIILDENLDLSDEEIIAKFEELWRQICFKEKEEIANINRKLYPQKKRNVEEITGKKIDFIFNYFNMGVKYKSIKAIGYYPNRREKDFYYKIDLKSGHLTGLAKNIYCVKDYKKIVNRKMEGVYIK